MWGMHGKGNKVSAAVTAMAALALSADAAEADVLPAGTACTFELAVEVSGGERRRELTFVDRDGNTVRSISAGVGYRLTFTNVSTGATLSLPANGAVMHTRLNPDGTRTEMATGHTVLLLFPTDEPAGPSTTLHVGRVVYDVAPVDDFTVLSASGRQIDICAALS